MKKPRKAASTPDITTIGSTIGSINVQLSYKIVELFSEGLYSSPHKAVEELVANSFDAGASKVAIFLPPDFHAQGATIAVLDDGEGMDSKGLKQHWLIGISNKKGLKKLPKGRNQIGKFGIGKLATYVLASNLTHISKKGGKFYSTSMDYGRIDTRVKSGVEPNSPIKIGLRQLTEDEAKTALTAWTSTIAFKNYGFKLFGSGSSQTWTFAVLSNLKEMVHDIARGTLSWVLRTALPLRPDFAIYMDGEKLEPSKLGKGRIKKWILGKDIKSLEKPAPKGLSVLEDSELEDSDVHRFGLDHPKLGRITGYMEIYKDLLTGKSDAIDRSHGIFVYVRGRLVNIMDGHFGISPNDLKHGTFNRFRLVVYMEGLNDEIRSNRETLRQGGVLTDTQNLFKALFNLARQEYEKYEQGEDIGTTLARKMGGSPASLARRPIIEMVRSAFSGKIKSRYIVLPPKMTSDEQKELLASLETRSETPETFVTGIDIGYDATIDDPIAAYDAVSGRLRINGLHPFVGAFFDEFTSKVSGLPLEVFAMAEVLLESHLFHEGAKQDMIDTVLAARDQLLRNVAQESGRRTALTVANALRNARNDQVQLEIEVVEAFRSLGFEATRLGKKGKPDGIAEALLAPDAQRQPRSYKVSLEAKSKEKEGAKVSAKSVGISGIARQRKEFTCQHAVVVGQLFPTTQAEASALAKEIKDDRDNTAKTEAPGTVTLIHVDDLARLVQHRPVKAITLLRIREMLQTCHLPQDCKAWIDKVIAEKSPRHNYAAIIETIVRLQASTRHEPVEYGELRAELRHLGPPIDYADLEELREVCKRMAGLAPMEVVATDRTVELNQSARNVLAKIDSATKAHLAGGQ
jgi:hypothetical protein